MKKIIFILSLLVGRQATALNCDYTISLGNFVGTISNSVQAVSHSFSIKRGSKSKNCENFRAFFSMGGAGSYNRQAFGNGQSIPYNLYSDSSLSSVLKDSADAVQANEYIQGDLINDNSNYNFSFYVKQVDLDTVFTTGTGYFGDNLQVSFYNIKSNGDLEYQTTAYFYLQLIIPRYAELSLVPLNGAHDPSATQYVMDFGNLTSGDTKSASLNVKGNVGFGVYMTSQNGSKLVNGPTEVPYQVKVGPTNYTSLAAGQETYMFQRNTGTSQNAENYPLYVELGTVPQNAEAGNYLDVITVVVKAW